MVLVHIFCSFSSFSTGHDFNSFRIFLLSTYCVPGSGLGVSNKVVNQKTYVLTCWAHSSKINIFIQQQLVNKYAPGVVLDAVNKAKKNDCPFEAFGLLGDRRQ